MEANAHEQANKDKLVADMKVVLTDVEDLLKQAATATGERAHALRDRAAEQLRTATHKMSELQEVALDKGKRAVQATDDFVHEHPWKAVGIAAAAGVLLGLLVNRK